MITRKNISKSYLSKKKWNRNRNKNDRVKQIGGASIDDKLKERLNFFNEFGKADSDADAEANTADKGETKND